MPLCSQVHIASMVCVESAGAWTPPPGSSSAPSWRRWSWGPARSCACAGRWRTASGCCTKVRLLPWREGRCAPDGPPGRVLSLWPLPCLLRRLEVSAGWVVLHQHAAATGIWPTTSHAANLRGSLGSGRPVESAQQRAVDACRPMGMSKSSSCICKVEAYAAHNLCSAASRTLRLLPLPCLQARCMFCPASAPLCAL
jgi:hypothetical protein